MSRTQRRMGTKSATRKKCQRLTTKGLKRKARREMGLKS